MIEKPHEISERNLELARQYSLAAQELGQLKKNAGVRWLLFKKTVKTNKEADMLYDASPEGQREIELTYLCKGIEKELSAGRSHLRVLDVFGN